jgi:hypothetical protein
VLVRERKKTVVGSRAHAPPPVLYTRSPRHSLAGIPRALMAHPPCKGQTWTHGTWRSCTCTHTLDTFFFLTLVVAFATLPIERSGRETYSAEDGGGYRGRRSVAVGAGAPHISRGPLRLCVGGIEERGSERESGACED